MSLGFFRLKREANAPWHLPGATPHKEQPTSSETQIHSSRGRDVAGCPLAVNELLFVKKARGEVVHTFFTGVELAYESLRAASYDGVDIEYIHARVGFRWGSCGDFEP